ncbi:MAG: hypothetical protein CMH46_08795 [Muricauda sp.]|nr:hypothetical protein [Allomuricauda sp.]|tara:strand:- start:3958 stop:4332 length:375 start_codon:yes stop_codon:yes gene_type:complete
MEYAFQKDFYGYMAVSCALALIIAIFPFEGWFYDYLRLLVFIGAVLTATKSLKKPFVLLSFVLIAYLFNPIFPVHLYQKSIWFPVDVICALMFMANTFRTKKTEPFIPYKRKKTIKSYGRDRKY